MTTTADPTMEAPAYDVKDFLDPAQLRRDLQFSPADISTAMVEQASLFAHYGVLLADASRQVDVVELLLENTEAAVYQLLRNEATSKGEKVTEVMLEKQVLRHKRVIAMKRALNAAKRVESLCKTAVEAFRHRRDMLVQQGAISREELKGELRMNAISAQEDAVEAKKRAYLDSLKTQ